MKSDRTLPELKENPWDTIYFGALEQNKEKIDAALPYATITIKNGTSHSPVYALAFDGKPNAIDALNFLLTNYPTENTAILKEMLRGYLDGNRLDLAKAIMQSNMSAAQLWILTREYIVYCAKHGHEQEIEDTLASITPKQQHYLLPLIAQGSTWGGNVFNITDHPDDRHNIKTAMTKGICARGGKLSELSALWVGASFIEKLDYLESAVMQYTLHRHLDSAKQLLIEHYDHFDTLADIMMKYLILPDDMDLANYLLERVGNKVCLYSRMLFACAYQGNIHFTNELLLAKNYKKYTGSKFNTKKRNYSIPILMQGYILNWHIESAKKIQAQASNISEIKARFTIDNAKIGNVEEVNLTLAAALQTSDTVDASVTLTITVISYYVTLGMNYEVDNVVTRAIPYLVNQAIAEDPNCRTLTSTLPPAILLRVNEQNAANPDVQNFLTQIANENTDMQRLALHLLHIRHHTHRNYQSYLDTSRAHGYARIGNVIEINKLITQLHEGLETQNVLLKVCTEKLIRYGYPGKARQLCNTVAAPEHKVETLMTMGHLDANDIVTVTNYVNNASPSSQLLKDITTKLVGSYLMKSSSALCTLSMFRPVYQKIIVEHINDATLTAQLPEAEKLHTALTTKSPLTDLINLPFKFQHNWPILEDFILHTAPILHTKNLNQDLIELLATYVVPMSIELSMFIFNRFSNTYPQVKEKVMDERHSEEPIDGKSYARFSL